MTGVQKSPSRRQATLLTFPLISYKQKHEFYGAGVYLLQSNTMAQRLKRKDVLCYDKNVFFKSSHFWKRETKASSMNIKGIHFKGMDDGRHFTWLRFIYFFAYRCKNHSFAKIYSQPNIYIVVFCVHPLNFIFSQTIKLWSLWKWRRIFSLMIRLDILVSHKYCHCGFYIFIIKIIFMPPQFLITQKNWATNTRSIHESSS